jgi:hypothetical protein
MNDVARAIAAEIASRRAGLAAQDRHAAEFPAVRSNFPGSRRAQDLACISGMVIALSFVIGAPYDVQAAEDLIRQAGLPDEEHAAASSAAFQAEAEMLAGEIGDLTQAWAAATEVDTNLGDDVLRAGHGLVHLASRLATAIARQNLRQAAQLHDLAAELAEAVCYYTGLDEHDADASIDIFGRLGPGIAHVLRVIPRDTQPRSQEC